MLSIYVINKYSFGYVLLKFNFGLLADIFDFFFTKLSHVHGYHTRSQCNFHVRAWRTPYVDRSVKCRGTILWNQLKNNVKNSHYDYVIMGAMASQITSITIVYSTVYSGTDRRKHQSSASLVFVRGIHRWPVNSPHKGRVTGKMFPFDDAIMP